MLVVFKSGFGGLTIDMQLLFEKYIPTCYIYIYIYIYIYKE